MTRYLALSGALLLGCAVASPGAATVVSPDTTYYFAGDCTDCTGQGKAELTLFNYTLGDAITKQNFVSFHYDGTDLLGAFTIDQNDVTTAYGAINAPLPNPETVRIGGAGEFFSSSSDGNWCVGRSCISDYGPTHLWSGSPNAGSVPEPASWATMLAGFGAIGYALRRRRVALDLA